MHPYSLINFPAILYRKKAVLTLSFLMVISLVSLKVISPPLYKAETIIMIEPKTRPTSIEPLILSAQEYVVYIKTQIELMKNRVVLERLVKQLDLVEKDKLLPKSPISKIYSVIKYLFFRKKTVREEILIENYVKKLRKKVITIEPILFTNLVNISVEYKDPELAAETANTFVKLFMEWDLEFIRKEITNVAEYLRDEIRVVKDRLRKSEDKLKKYLEDSGIALLEREVGRRVDRYLDCENMFALSSIDEARISAELNEIRKKMKEQEVRLASSETISSVPSINSGRTRLVELELELLASLRDFTEESPQVKAIRTKIDLLKKTISQDVSRIITSDIERLSSHYNLLVENVIRKETELVAHQAKMKSLQILLDTYKKEIIGVPQRLVEARRLRRKIDTDELVYLKLVREQEKNRLLSAEKKVGHIRLVAPAIVPFKPKESKLLIIILGVFIAVIISIGSAVALEYIDNSIKRAQDVTNFFNLPLWGIIPYEDKRVRGFPNATNCHPQFFEAFRKLRIRLHFAAKESMGQVFQICSTTGKEGRTAVSMNLAILAAEAGSKTLLIDCNLKKPILYNAFNIDIEKELIAAPGQLDWKKGLKTTDIKNLYITTVGAFKESPIELFKIPNLKVLLAGKHILVEKPLAHSSTKAKELIKIADRRKLVLMVGHTFVYSPAVVKIKEMISEGILGKIYYISTSRVNLGIHQPDISVLWDLAPHDFSIIVYLLGEKPKYISTMAQDCVRKGIYDVSFINMRFASGTIAHVHLSWLAPTKLRRTIIVGDKRMIVYDDTLPDEKIKLYDRGVEFKEPKTFGEYELFYRVGKMISPPLDIHEPLNAEVDHFLRCCKTGKRPKTGGHEALQVIELIEAAERSLYNNGRLEVIK